MNTRRLSIRFYRNKPRVRSFGIGRLPVGQTLIWAGPLFVLIRRGEVAR